MTTKALADNTIRSLRQKLLAARARAVDVLEQSARDLDAAAEVAEAEVAERSQEEAAVPVTARFAERGFASLREIEGALARIAKGTYGVCVHCGEQIPVVRLRVFPATPFCTECAAAAAVEATAAAPSQSAKTAGGGRLRLFPPELVGTGDAEVAALVREQFADEVGDALGTVRVLCRHGVIMLDGEVASDELRATAVRIVEEEMGLEAVDRLWVTPIAREGRGTGIAAADSGGGDGEALGELGGGGEDMYEILEDEVIEYTPPQRPPP